MGCTSSSGNAHSNPHKVEKVDFKKTGVRSMDLFYDQCEEVAKRLHKC